MIARSVARVGAGGRLETLASQPPLTLRRIRHDDPRVCALCLVNSAAGPLAGDDLGLDLILADGALAELTATGAAIAQGCAGAGGTGPDGPARARMAATAEVGERARLVVRSAPVIVARGGALDLSVRIRLAATASLDWRELLILGRTDERAGALRVSWSVTRAGRPVLRQSIDLGRAEPGRWPGMLAGGRVMATALLTAPTLAARTDAMDATAVVQTVDEHTILATVLDVSAASATRRLGALLATTGGALDPDRT